MADNKDIIMCPACGEEMKKVYIKSADCNVDICIQGCGGIFLDNRELQKFDEEHENIDEILAAYKDKNYNKVNENSQRICPYCKSVMVKHHTGKEKETEIDECYSCGAVFLDYGELEAIREQISKKADKNDALQTMFDDLCDISEFKDYKSKSPEELFGKRKTKLINLFNKLF